MRVPDGRWLAWLTVVLMLSSCKVTPSRAIQLPPPFESSGVRVQTMRMVRAAGTYVGVTGVVTNLGDRTVRSCTVTYDGLNLLSERVDVAEVTLGPLEAGESVEFRAPFRRRQTSELARVQPAPLRVIDADGSVR